MYKLEICVKMNIEKQITCRLCLNNITDGNTEVIGKICLEFIALVIPSLDLTVSEEPVMCGTCSGCLKRCFDFKSMCLRVEDRIKLFPNAEGEITLSEIYKELKGVVGTITNLEDKICRLCFNSVASDFKSLEDDAMSDMIHEYLPELNLRLCSDPILCSTCLDKFRSYVSFTSSCSNVEAEIARYLNSVGFGPKGLVELAQVALFTQRNLDSITDRNIEGMQIKPESVLIQNIKTETIESYNQEYFALGEVKCEVKDERVIEVVLNDVKEEPDAAEDDQKYFACDNLDLGIEKSEIDMEEEAENFNSSRTVKNEDSAFGYSPDPHPVNPASIAQDPSPPDAEEPAPSQPPLPTTALYKCHTCTYTTKYHAYLIRHAKRHKSEVVTRRRTLKTPTSFQCAQCDYTTPHQYRLKEHGVIHKDPSEVPQFTCEQCGLKTKWRSTLRKHSLIHKDRSEFTMFSCELCAYTTKSREYLQRHLLVHKAGPLFQCRSCSFQTKYESYLRRHALTHTATPAPEPPKEEPARSGAHVCPLCGYKAGRRSRLHEHMLTHQGSGEVHVYQCKTCDFQTKWRNSFNKHTLMHGGGAAMFACDLCDYRTPSRSYLNRHSIVHKDPTEMEMQKCELCGFETKTKHNLMSHMLRHVEPEAAPVFECGECGYKARRKGQLAKHVVCHSKVLANKTFQCEVCEFKTKWVQSLRVHQLGHKK